MGNKNTIFQADCPTPKVYKLPNNPDDKINAIKTTSTCISEDYDYLTWQFLPPGGEYRAVDYSERPRCGCDGTKIVYYRESFKGKPLTCCLTGESGSTTACDPKYRNMDSSACAPIMRDYCFIDNNIFADSGCKQWCTLNPDECMNKKIDLCNNLNSFETNYQCRDFCIQNPGKCDTSMNLYCKKTQNIGKPECSCVNSLFKQYKYNPLCQDKECINAGYSTAPMINSLGDGCQIIDCSVAFNLEKTGQVQFNDADIDQRCGKDESTLEEEVEIFSNSKETLAKIVEDLDENDEKEKSTWWIWLIVIIVLLLLVGGIGIGIYYYTRKKAKLQLLQNNPTT
uniref:Uncharacterized protein n=1 Tax=viral metagenome TaxID=1070528 RepID=A0A6C0J9F1_9ZZZZ